MTDASAGELLAAKPPIDGWVVDASSLTTLHGCSDVWTAGQDLGLNVVVRGVSRLRDRDQLAELGFAGFEGPAFGQPRSGRGFLRWVRELNR